MEQMIAAITTLRWQDFVDIIVNSYILFRLYVLFQGTNAFRILVGIALLLVLQEVAGALGLILTSWALQGITAAAAIIIVVVFRNEIRSVLQVQNLKTFIWGLPVREEGTCIDIVVDSVYHMGKKRTGALLVFPGKEDLSEVVHGGVNWDGQVSQEMITSIFWPNNPVHDGAIVVEGRRISEVGVLLPLSQRQDLPTFYGTRHRAAAGLAERTDALVVVVSEERGRVSVAQNGNIKPVGQPEELAQILRSHLNISVEKVQSQRKKRELLRLSLAGLVSFLVITSIWFGFTRSRDTVIALDAPIEYVNRPADMEIVYTSVAKVRLQLNGSSALIKSLRPNQVQVRLDLSGITEGEHELPITSSEVILPPGVFLNKADPPKVQVVLNKPVVKVLPVQVDWTGKLPENLILADVKVSPEKVKVMGRKEVLEGIDTVFTTPVRLENLSQSGSLTTTLVLTLPSVKLAPNEADKVTVQYCRKTREQPEEGR